MKVFLYAYDHQNLGDDLFVHTISKRYPDVKFYLWSKKFNEETFRDVKNLKVVDQDSQFGGVLKKIHPSLFPKYKSKLELSCDAVVYIGGSIFIEYDNWQQILTWWDYEAKNRNFYILGANFGPYKTEAYRDNLADILKNVNDICFRDRYSADLFSDVNNVRYAPDILFSAKMPERKNFEKRAFVSVIDCKAKSEGINQFDLYEKNYLACVQNLSEQLINDGYKVTFASFCKEEGDENVTEKLARSINSDVSVLHYDGTNVNAVLQEISDSDFIVASRFHAAVLGFAADKPVLPVVYSDKTSNILKDLNFDGTWLDIRNLSDSADINIQTLDFEKQKLKNINTIKEQSEEHFALLDNVLME